jgi:hypothetical protein
MKTNVLDRGADAFAVHSARARTADKLATDAAE